MTMIHPFGTETTLRRLGVAGGVIGPALLTVYFAAPAFSGWPEEGASPATLLRYARAHATLFYLGGWLQVTGAALSVGLFLVLLHLSGARKGFAGMLTMVGAALLLATVVIEAAFLEEVPMAAANGDLATVATAFALSNGVFARIFPLASAPLLFAGIGMALWNSDILSPRFARAALLIAGLFEVAGVAAIFGSVGLIFAIVMSVLQEVWIVGAAIGLARRPGRLETEPDRTELRC
jgi:hypothetical protein